MQKPSQVGGTFLTILGIIVGILSWPEAREYLGMDPGSNRNNEKIIQEDQTDPPEITNGLNIGTDPIIRVEEIPVEIVKKPEQILTPITKDFSIYVNPSLLNSSASTEISVTIVDESGNFATEVAALIADIYSNQGKKGNIGLIRSSLVTQPEFQELFEGNSDIIEKLKLNIHTDYLAIGKLKYSFRAGTLVNGTIICEASVKMNIISTLNKSISKSFVISNANGNGVTEAQAKEEALNKLMRRYNEDHSSL